jgi:hypothetical protein
LLQYVVAAKNVTSAAAKKFWPEAVRPARVDRALWRDQQAADEHGGREAPDMVQGMRQIFLYMYVVACIARPSGSKAKCGMTPALRNPSEL